MGHVVSLSSPSGCGGAALDVQRSCPRHSPFLNNHNVVKSDVQRTCSFSVPQASDLTGKMVPNRSSFRRLSSRRSLHFIIIFGTLLFGFVLVKVGSYTIHFYSSGQFVRYHMDMTPSVQVQDSPVKNIPTQELGYSAVVLYLINASRLRELMLSLFYLHHNVPMQPWPIILFYADDMNDQSARVEFMLRLYDFLGGDQEVRSFLSRIEFERLEWSLPPGISHNKVDVDPVFIHAWPGFHLMSNFFATQIFGHPRLRDVTYFMRLDTDSFIFKHLCYDPLEVFHAYNRSYGYRSRSSDPAWLTRGMWEYADDFVREHPEVEKNLGKNAWTWPTNRESIKMKHEPFPSYYNNFEIVRLDAFRRPDVQEWLRGIDRDPQRIYKYRWSDGAIRYATRHNREEPSILCILAHRLPQRFRIDGRGGDMPEVRQASPLSFRRLKRREWRSSPGLSAKEFLRPLNVDIPDTVLPRRYRRHGVLLDDLELDMQKLEKMESPASTRPCSEFPPRAGQAVYVGRRTPRFYLAAFRNLANRRLRRSKSSGPRRGTRRRRRLFVDIVVGWIEKRKKRWIEPRRHDGKDLRIFYSVYNLIDRLYGGARIRYREEIISGSVYYRVKFEHHQRGKVEVMETSLGIAVKEMQYELEFEGVSCDETQFADLFQVIDKKFPGAKVMHKTDKYGRRHVKVEHAICGFRTCAKTTEEAIGILIDLYSNDMGVRGDRRMKRFGGIFDGEYSAARLVLCMHVDVNRDLAMDLFYPGSRLLYRQISHGLWHAKIVHEVDGVIATGKSCTLEFTLARLRSELENNINHLQDSAGSIGRWRC
ncbi:nucleotide-diphospho-sugar transferase [Sanghuangporus baumii]|uniref:Nucleotide-diphospho-sugar transferase n=1 Tax=Sanghuangporus baumii TaxID=108892 RepID=A0A9Q5N5Q8_SANBA|nr:nucleotide-diphospho-sugar transferase [Sanghuangporus baumii]